MKLSSVTTTLIGFSVWVNLAADTCGTPPSPERIFPAETVIDVTLPPYGAVPNDGRDDFSAIQAAVSQNLDKGRTIYLPAGVYDLSSGIVCTNTAGLWRPHVTIQGQGRNLTVLRLSDHARGFGNPAEPKAVITTGSFWQDGDKSDGGGNKAFRNNVFDLTVETGRANPGAMGISWAVSNIGSLENVTVRDTSGDALIGIAMTRSIPGPGLLRDVVVEGFGIGVKIDDIQYGITAVGLTVRNQRESGVCLGQNQLQAKRFTSENCVPAVRVTRLEGMVTLIDASLTGGTNNVAAIDCDGTMLLRNVKTSGYGPHPLRAYGTRLETGADIPFFIRSPSCPRGRVPTLPPSALLPMEEAPPYVTPPLEETVCVGERRPGEPDDTAAIQRALDAGKGTVYWRNDRVYFISDTLVVRGKVRQLVGMGAEINLGAGGARFSDSQSPYPLIRIDKTESDTVMLENLFLNAQYPGEVLFENNTSSTVVIRHCSGWVGSEGHRHAYRNTPQGKGKLFIEDVFLPGWTFTGQTVWAVQLNPENWDGDGTEPQVLNAGGKLSILGFKTEGPAPFLKTVARGTSEVFGGYNYVSATKLDPVPPDGVPYSAEEAVQRIGVVTDNFRSTDYRVYLRETTKGKTTEKRRTEMMPRNGNAGGGSFGILSFE